MKQPELVTEQQYLERMPQICKELAAFEIRDMVQINQTIALCCYRYVKPEHQKNLVILHGFTEFAEKYREMVWYYFSLGYNVFVYDQRGHGFSTREVEDLGLVHVDSFEQYVDDLEQIIVLQVQKYGADGPLTLFGHSMGCAVAALYMIRHPSAVEKAVLSAPMISPKTHNIPTPLVCMELKRLKRKNGWNSRFPYGGTFNPNASFERSSDGSRTRFQEMMKQRIAVPQYQSSCATNRWIWESVRVKKDLLRTASLKPIQTKVLLFRAQNDRIVKNPPQMRFAKKLAHCRVITVAGAKHNMFFGSDRAMKEYYGEIFSFLEKE